MKTNKRARNERRTHEGAVASPITPEQELRRSVLAHLLWERSFYESGEDAAARVVRLCNQVDPGVVAALAIEAREQMKLRHVPLLMVRELARRRWTGTAETLERIVQRADELAEFLSLYWMDGRCPVSAQAKKGLARAFRKFSAYSLAKYDRGEKVKLRDVLFLCHAKPQDDEQAATWKQLVDGTLPVPDTWEVALSGGADKQEAWTRLLAERKLGGLALIRNLRNMTDSHVDDALIRAALRDMKADRVLPFRFIAAANHAPRFEPELEQAMFRCLGQQPKLEGHTVLLVDVSGSMVGAPISARSEIDRLDAAAGLAMLAREMCESVSVYAFSQTRNYRDYTINAYCVELPARRGFALRDKLRDLPHNGTPLGFAIRSVCDCHKAADRLIILTDEQSGDPVPVPTIRPSYCLNVASYQNGVTYGGWTHIDGWSESALRYVHELERHDRD